VIILLLSISLASILYAAGMGEMGSVGSMADKISIRTEKIGEVVFSHRRHGANCGLCHPKIFKKQRNSNHVSMKMMERGMSCGACHNGRRAFSVTGDCSTCHAGDVAIQTVNLGKVIFSHEIHTGMFGCDECHPDLFKPQKNSNHATMKAMEEGKSCGACHDGGTAFDVTGDCVTCHVGDVTIESRRIGKIVFSHGIHTGMFGCGECHPDLFKAQNNSNHVTMKAMEEGKSCGACHDGETAFGVAGDCVTCHSNAKDITIESRGVGPVMFSHDIHTGMFGCVECHPDVFRPKNNNNHPTMKSMEEGRSCGACHNGEAAFGVGGDCVTCHTIAVDITIQTENVGKVMFSHDIHTGMFGCGECHPGVFQAQNNSNHTTMKAMEEGKSCGACHDGSTAFGVAGDCATCHTEATDIAIQTENVGKVTFSHGIHLGMFGCGECHPGLFKPQNNSNRATMKEMEDGASCGACHDGGTAFGVSGDCATCHTQATDIEMPTKNAGPVVFSHDIHTGMFGCGECHPDVFKPQKNSNHATMRAMGEGASCGACHDGSTAFGVTGDCAICHPKWRSPSY
jgi:c(7)-type cytochrome triheme protein